MKRLEMRLKHPLAIRWCHWVNFPLLALTIWSGLWIYWAHDVYRLGLGSFTLFRFFPEGFYRAFGVSHQLAHGMAYHFFFMWFFALNGVVYVAYTLFSGEWRHSVPNPQSFRIGAPMYNFTFSSMLKAWIDQVVRVGKTFAYGPTGRKGLLSGKRLVVITSRGGAYTPGTPTAQFDFQEPYLRQVLGFMGMTDVTFIHAENQARAELAELSRAAALDRIGPSWVSGKRRRREPAGGAGADRADLRGRAGNRARLEFEAGPDHLPRSLNLGYSGCIK